MRKVATACILQAFWLHYSSNGGFAVPVNLSIRNVPDEVAERLRARAKANHRSLQGELMEVVKEASVSPPRKLSVAEVATEIGKLGLPRSRRNESTKMIRDDRDNR
jgi:plasmid stability protein